MSNDKSFRLAGAGVLLASLLLLPGQAEAQTYSYARTQPFPLMLFPNGAPLERTNVAPAERIQEPQSDAAIDPQLRRQIVSYQGREAPGTVIIDTSNTYLYYVLGNGRAVRYGIGVGREGFTWSGVQSIARKTEWPDWHPPAEMIARQPYLPRFMAGGESNPLGARAMYLGNSIYRIHGTNAPSTIGGRVSSGCIRMLNEDVIDLYERVNIGTKVVVLPDTGRAIAATRSPSRQSANTGAPLPLQTSVY
jgi:lipoprotein-anchoring transpeptidase ErfK/SrfK